MVQKAAAASHALSREESASRRVLALSAMSYIRLGCNNWGKSE